MTSFTEYDRLTAGTPLRQGDVLETTSAGTPWDRTLFVITADCDLAHEKHQGRITCVPLLTSEEYLREIQIPKLRTRFAKRALDPLISIVDSNGGPKLSPDRTRQWATEQSTTEILEQLQMPKLAATQLHPLLEALHLIDSKSDSLSECSTYLVKALEALGAKQAKAKNEVLSALREPYKQPPGDALFIGSLSPDHVGGYFAYLRHLEQIWEPEIALQSSRRAASYRRISRFQDKITDALVQRFALVFMSIGLPRDYEENRDLHALMLEEAF